MTSPRRSALFAALTLGLLCAARTAAAADVPPAVAPFPGIPLGPVLPVTPDAPPASPAYTPYAMPPPPEWTRYTLTPPPKRQWYGWQILLPTVALDMTMFASFFAGNGGSASTGVAISALVGRGIAGPIVHVAHGQYLKALASFGLEAALPGAVIGAAYAAGQQCSSTLSDDDFCTGPIITLIVGLPLALIAGAAIDSAALGWEDHSAASKRDVNDAKVTWSVAPIVLPPLRPGTAHAGPTPAGAGLVGTF